MDNVKKPVSLSKKAIWTLIVVGIIRLFFGVAGCFNESTLRLISACILIGSSFITLVFLKIKVDKTDELAEKNLMESSILADDIINVVLNDIVLVAIGLYFYVKSKNIDNQISISDFANYIIHIPFAFIGIKNILTGIFFIRKERE